MCVSTGMGEFGANSWVVERLVERAGGLTLDEAADIYHARATRLLIYGAANNQALADARRVAIRVKRQTEYEKARHTAATAWRAALPEMQGPWLMVGAAIANAAGALVLEDVLDPQTFRLLIGPWQQAIGRLVPVGPGTGHTQRRQPEAQRHGAGGLS